MKPQDLKQGDKLLVKTLEKMKEQYAHSDEEIHTPATFIIDGMGKFCGKIVEVFENFSVENNEFFYIYDFDDCWSWDFDMIERVVTDEG